MSIKSRKLFAILVIAMMLMTLLPVTAFATSTNSVDKVPQVAVDYEFTKDPPALKVKQKDNTVFDTVYGETFRLVLTNAEWLTNDDGDYYIETGTTAWANAANVKEVDVYSKTRADVTIIGDNVEFPLYTVVTGEGEAQVTIDSRDSRVSGGTYTFAISAAGRTIASIEKVVTFGRTADLGTIEIDETRIGALTENKQKVRIKLPPRFTWVVDGSAEIDFTGGLARSLGAYIEGNGERTLVLEIEPVTDRESRGSILLEGFKIRADRDAPLGDVVADFDGDYVTSEDLVIAKYADYSIVAEVKEVEELVAGRYENVTAKITIKENIPNSMIVGREITVLLPEWVKINEVKELKGFNMGSGDAKDDLEYAKDKNEIYFVVPDDIDDTKTSRYEFKLDLSIEADKSGDITAQIFGAGMEEQELVIAKAVAPITAEVAVSDLKIGVQNQDAPDIIITETKKGMIDDGYIQAIVDIADNAEPNYYSEYGDKKGADNVLTVSLPANHDFSSTPTVEVTEGNLEIGKPSVKDNVLSIPILSSSTQPSTIKISNVKVTLDRTVPEGAFYANIGGSAIVKNSLKDATLKTPVLFDKGRVVRFHFANVITPAPGETRATTTFTIGSTSYTVVEAEVAVEKTMDVAPYIKDGRTYLPVRFVAEALGVTEDNILWDPVSRKVTIFKGDRIAQMTIDSTTLLVNGVELTMDVAPEITNGRTMLPVRWMTQALGATIAWDAETQTVTVTQ